jgi:LysR family transcriptional regulator, transcriptional activator of nhaA
MNELNYHHLRYFREVAHEGNLTRAAQRLNVSQSALSSQIRSLEDVIGEPLFSREHKSMTLTEAGKIALDYSDTIFTTGSEMLDTLRHGFGDSLQMFRVGAMATLSRNFQFDFLRPAFQRDDLDLVLRSGSLAELMEQLTAHNLDLALTNIPVKRDARHAWNCHLIQEQPVSLVGRNRPGDKKFNFPQDLDGALLQLPSYDSHLRVEFERLISASGVRPRIVAEVDDMAMLRLLAKESDALTLAPPVVVKDELASGDLYEHYRMTEIQERFYAIVPVRRKPNPLVMELLNAKR